MERVGVRLFYFLKLKESFLLFLFIFGEYTVFNSKLYVMKKLLIALFIFGIVFNLHSQDTNQIYYVVEIPAVPVKGESVFHKWIKEKSLELKEKYQISCEKDDTIAIYISFILDENGNISKPKTIRGIETNIDNDALDLVKNMEIKWKPAMNKGKNVAVQMIAPFSMCPKEIKLRKSRKKRKKI